MPKVNLLMLLSFIIIILPFNSMSQKIRIATDLWSGSGILYLAEEKGFFKEAGLDIELVYYDDYVKAIQAFRNGEVDGQQAAISDVIYTALKGKQFIGIFSPASNKGFDQIVGNIDIKSISGLKGKRVAYAKGTVGHLLLIKLLHSIGLTEQDIISVEADFITGKEKFENNEVDATASIFLNMPEKSHVIFSTQQYPLPDVFIFNKKIIEDQSDDFIKFVKVWQKTVNYYRANFTESVKIMNRKLNIDGTSILYESLVINAPILDLYDNIFSFCGENAEIKNIVKEIIPFLQEHGNLTAEEYQNSKLFIDNIDQYLNEFFLNINGYALHQNIDTLIFGVINHKGYEAVYNTYKPMVSYICNELSKKLSIKIADSLVIVNYRELAYPLHNNKIHIGIFNPYSYINAAQNFPDLEVFAFHSMDGDSTYNGVITVRESSNINSLSELKNKSFLFVDSSSTSGFKYPSKYFEELDIIPDTSFFSSVGFSGSHDKSIISFALNEVDGIATYEKAFEDPLLVEKYHLDTIKKKFLREVDIPHNAYVFSPSLNTLYKKYIKETMFEAHINPQTSEIFYNNVKINSWDQCGDDIFNPLRNIFHLPRIKPKLSFSFNKHVSLTKEDRITLEITEEIINSTILESNRFNTNYIDIDNNPYIHLLTLSLSKPKENNYKYLISLDNRCIANGSLTSSELDSLPELVIKNCLTKLDIIAKLSFNQKNNYWSINYGTSDGINNEDYDFILSNNNNENVILDKSEIISVDEYNILVKSHPKFIDNMSVIIRYNPKEGTKFNNPVTNQSFALFFASDEYIHSDNWSALKNPIKDANSVATELYDKYNFDTTLVLNPGMEKIEMMLEESFNYDYGQNDQLFIFFAGHGYFKETTSQGFIVANDSYGTSGRNYFSFSDLADILSKHPCEHIFLVIDVCYSGTFFPTVALRDGNISDRGAIVLSINEINHSNFIKNSLKYKTRVALTSSGKEVVSDGITHSPFAFKLLEILRTTTQGTILTVSSIKQAVQQVPPFPKMGGFGNNEPGSDFIFVAQ